MKTIILKQLKLFNFKGIRDLTIDFDEKLTEIRGTNATGKTTLIDAFLWLLFGKDSTDRKDFEIKTLDPSNKVFEKLDHEITGILDIDGRIITLKRCLREKWTKRRGSEEAEFTGHETLFYVDEVPYQAGQYSDFINSLVDESMFKILTNPHYFNSLKWETRRQVLINIAGEITDAEIMSLKPEFKDIVKVMEGKSFKEFKTMIAAQKKKLKDDIDQIPARIDEAQRRIPQEPDYVALEMELKQMNADLANIDGQIGDILKQQQDIFSKESDRRDRLFSLKNKLKSIEYFVEQKATEAGREKKSQLNGLNSEKQALSSDIMAQESAIRSNNLKMEFNEKKVLDLRKSWHEENEKVLIFDENDFVCPACKREYEAVDIEAKKSELTANFNRGKVEKLKSISSEGAELNKISEVLKQDNQSRQDQVSTQRNRIVEIENRITELSKADSEPIAVNYSTHPDYAKTKSEIASLESAEPFKAPDNSELKQKKAILQARIDEIKIQLSVRIQADQARARVKELEAELKSKSQQLASLEKQEFIADDFTNTKMNLVESRVNRMFRNVQFKLFEKLINGGTEPTCITLINGVPWSDANNAGRINAGLDIIRTLSNHYQVSAPIFVDNAESIVDLLTGDFQLIKLIVSEKHKKLTVSSGTIPEMAEIESEMA